MSAIRPGPEAPGGATPLLEVPTSPRGSRPTAASCTRSTACRSPSSAAAPLGIVGESGSGKTVLSRSIMGLLPKQGVRAPGLDPVRGGGDRHRRRPRQMRKYWGAHMAMVFQDPMTSLNPVMKIGKQITESIHTHLDVTRTFANELAVSLLESVRVPDPRAPHGRVPAPALRRPAPTGVHRGRAGVRPAAAARRRADHRARRDRAGPGARRARGAAARAVHGDGARHPRPRRRRRARRRGDRDVRGPGRGEGADRDAVLRHEDALHRGAAPLDPEDRPSPATPGCPPSPGARPISCTRRPAAGSRRGAPTCRTAAARSSRRCGPGTRPVTSSAAGSRSARPRARAALEPTATEAAAAATRDAAAPATTGGDA